MQINFSKIHIEEQERYQASFSKCPQHASDYSFVNLWSWADEYDLSWSWKGNLVWIRQSKPEFAFWAPIGNWGQIDWAALLNADFLKDAHFIRIPEALLRIWEMQVGQRLEVFEARDQWDYIYSLEELATLKGNRFHKKKNLVNQFKKNNEFEYRPFDPAVIEGALALQTDWCNWRDCEASETLAAENRAIVKVLENWEKLPGLIGGAIAVGDDLPAYTIAEPLSEDTLVIHFEKGCPGYKGIYQAINQVFLAHNSKGYKLVNREQDLGNEGLRKAKLSYQPIDFLKKYRVVIR
jgi:hypothetical protein